MNQGDTMKVCIKLEPDVPGACITEVESLDLAIDSFNFPILPTCGLPNCLFPAIDGTNLNPNIPGKVDQDGKSCSG